jgi:hypothetical protein
MAKGISSKREGSTALCRFSLQGVGTTATKGVRQMGDKGKKDKDKSQKQKVKKQEQNARKNLEKLPAKAPSSRPV